MTKLNRRDLLLGTAFAGLSLLAMPALALDQAELNKPPAMGEMAMAPTNAKVTLIEYASASCPHCAEFHNNSFDALKSEYIDTGKIRFVFREFPHNDAALAAFMLARSVPKESYFPLIDVMFETQASWLENWPEGLAGIAKQAGIPKEKFDAILKDEALAKGIIAARDQGASLGVTGIPTFFLNGEKLEGEITIETLRAKIDPLLK